MKPQGIAPRPDTTHQAGSEAEAEQNTTPQPLGMIPVPKHLLARVLFPNPACVLVTPNDTPAGEDAGDDGPPTPTYNAMTITWLTPVDNHGTFAMSLNAGRHTAANLARDPCFTLSPAAAGMEELLVRLGSCSGREPPTGSPVGGRGRESDCVGRGKAAHCGLQLVQPGGAPWTPGTTGAAAVGDATAAAAGGEPPSAKRRRRAVDAAVDATPVPAAAGAPAHLVCRVIQPLLGGGAVGGSVDGESALISPSAVDTTAGGGSSLDIGHVIFLCRATAGWVRPEYWHEGKLFGAPPLPRGGGGELGGGDAPAPPHGAPAAPPAAAVPPLLCFAGSQRFVHMQLG